MALAHTPTRTEQSWGSRARLVVAMIVALSVALALSIGAAAGPASAAPGTASITGTVTSSTGGVLSALANVNVYAYNSSHTLVTNTSTNANGAYTLSALPSGAMYLEFVPVDAQSPYLLQWYINKDTFATANVLTLTTTTHDTSVNQTLPLGATISGTVNGGGGVHVHNADVVVYDSTSTEIAEVLTDSNGNYITPALVAGTYRLDFVDTSGEYLPQYWNNKGLLSNATPIVVAQSQQLTGIDPVLVGTGAIHGTVDSQDASAPLQGITVIAEYSTGSVPIGSTTSDAAGSYTVTGLPAGTYTLQFSAPGWVTSYFQNSSTAVDGQTVPLSVGDTDHIGMQQMIAGGSLTGVVVNAADQPMNATAVLYKDGATDDATTAFEIAHTNAGGTYLFNDLPVGSYRLGFTTNSSGWDSNFALADSSPFLSQWWGPDYTWATAPVFQVSSAGQSITGFNAMMQNPAFADVSDPTYTFYPYIQWMAQLGISTGTAQPTGKPLYLPANIVSRQAMAQFMYRLSGGTFVPPVTPTFADVDSSSQFYTAVEWMAEQGISTGTAQPAGKPLFKPADPVSRQAMALFLARYEHADVSTQPTTQSFADVPVSASSAAAIGWMATAGISTGTNQPSGLPLYKPADPVTRSAMAAFLYRVATLP